MGKKSSADPTAFYGDKARAAWEYAQQRPPKAKHKGTSFWPLPKELRKPFADADPKTGLGPCCCDRCSPTARKSAMAGCWDTLAVGNGEAWLVHHPALRGVPRKRKREEA